MRPRIARDARRLYYFVRRPRVLVRVAAGEEWHGELARLEGNRILWFVRVREERRGWRVSVHRGCVLRARRRTRPSTSVPISGFRYS